MAKEVSMRAVSKSSYKKSSMVASSSLAGSSQEDEDDDSNFLESMVGKATQGLGNLMPNLNLRDKRDSLDDLIREKMEHGDPNPGESYKELSSSKSTSSSSKLESSQKFVGGEPVTNLTLAEKSNQSKSSESEKVVEDGKVVVDKAKKAESSSKGKLKSTKKMTPEELDAFFREKSTSQCYPIEEMQLDKEKGTFDVKLQDLPDFCPDELTVKIVDNVITVIGRHEDQSDPDCYKSVEYIRKFTVPQGIKNDNVAWTLEPNGILAISAGDSVRGLQIYHLDCTLYRPKSFFAKKE